MAADITVDGMTFISSKRASELSGYTQDYIGQLARTGKLVARRIGGLWYVVEDSLRQHKEVAESYVPTPPAPHTAARSDSVVTFEGKAYTSAAKAAKTCGYHPDYVTQLARSEKIDSRHVGNRWYVDLAALKAHKKEKDALLAEVQSIAVGIRPHPDAAPDALTSPEQPEKVIEGATFDELHFTYKPAQAGHLLPPLPAKEPSSFSNHAIAQDLDVHDAPEKNVIPIRIVRGSLAEKSPELTTLSLNNGKKSHKTLYKVIFPLFFVSAVAAAYYFRAFEIISFPSFDFAQTTTIDSRIPSLSDIQEMLEDLFSKKIEFVRHK